MRSVFVALTVLLATGCTHVASYERGKLAHRTMTDELTSTGAEHVYAIHEGASGGTAVGSAGCGCN